MIVISGITISNPIGDLNSVIIDILNSGGTVITTIPYTGQSIITYNEPSDGIYYVRISDGTSSEMCELSKNVYIGNYQFTIGSGFDDSVNMIIQDTYNKYMCVGYFTSYSGVTSNRIIRLNPDGTIDNTFDSGTGFDSDVYTIFQDSIDGKYLVSGDYTMYNNTSAGSIIRLNNNGSIDYSFTGGTGFTNSATFIIKDDDKYLVGGTFYTYSGVSVNRIIRLNNDGTIDNTFSSGSGFNDYVSIIVKDSNGKYLIGGNFTSYSGVTANRIIRLNPDGTIDNTFSYGSGFNNIPGWMIQDVDNGKYLIGGNFTSYSGVTRNRIIRLNNDGSVDNTFNIGTGFDNAVYIITQDSNSKYVIGGIFYTYSGASANRIIRLNPNGTIDNTFNSGNGVDLSNQYVLTIIEKNGVNSDGYMIGGAFTQYDNLSRNRIASLNLNGGIT